jgi:hypothetical protein
VTPDPADPAERAAAVLRAAEAATAARRAQAPAPSAPVTAGPGDGGTAERLVRAADELADGVRDAEDDLEALRAALARVTR